MWKKPSRISPADETFKTLRAWSFALGRSELVKQHRPLAKDTVIEEVERGRRLTAMEIGHAFEQATGFTKRRPDVAA